MNRTRYYALRFPTSRYSGFYSALGRRCLVRTFPTIEERDRYVADAARITSVLHDGTRLAVPASTVLTEYGTGRAVPISECVPGL
jgi:hypothetical protein